MLISNIFSNYFRTIDKKIFSIQKPMNKINVFRNNDEDLILNRNSISDYFRSFYQLTVNQNVPPG